MCVILNAMSFLSQVSDEMENGELFELTTDDETTDNYHCYKFRWREI